MTPEELDHHIGEARLGMGRCWTERVLAHIAALETEVVQARERVLEEAAMDCEEQSGVWSTRRGGCEYRETRAEYLGHARALREQAERIRALKSRPAQEASPDTTGEADQPLPCGPVEMASENNGLLPKRRRSRMPPCGHARCEVLESGEEAHVATCPNFGTR